MLLFLKSVHFYICTFVLFYSLNLLLKNLDEKWSLYDTFVIHWWWHWHVIGNVEYWTVNAHVWKEGWSVVNGGVPRIGVCGVHGFFFLTQTKARVKAIIEPLQSLFQTLLLPPFSVKFNATSPFTFSFHTFLLASHINYSIPIFHTFYHHLHLFFQLHLT